MTQVDASISVTCGPVTAPDTAGYLVEGHLILVAPGEVYECTCVGVFVGVGVGVSYGLLYVCVCACVCVFFFFVSS